MLDFSSDHVFRVLQLPFNVASGSTLSALQYVWPSMLQLPVVLFQLSALLQFTCCIGSSVMINFKHRPCHDSQIYLSTLFNCQQFQLKTLQEFELQMFSITTIVNCNNFQFPMFKYLSNFQLPIVCGCGSSLPLLWTWLRRSTRSCSGLCQGFLSALSQIFANCLLSIVRCGL